jgi:hypothetical protein
VGRQTGEPDELSQNRRQVVLLALLVLLAVVWGGQRFLGVGANLDGSEGEGAAGTAELPGGAGPVGSIARVDLAALERQPGTFSPGRDPFRFFQEAPVQPTPPPAPPQEAARQAPPPQPVQQANAAPPKPRPPAIDFRYLGSFGSKGRKIAVFSDQNEIFNALQGDVIKQRFLVVGIGYESADIGFVGFPSEPAQRLAAGG